MNRTNVQRTIDYLRALPPEAPDFNMIAWFRDPRGQDFSSISTLVRYGHECGTSACLAGHIAFKFRDEIESDDIEWGAACFLGLDSFVAEDLFFARFRDRDVTPGIADVTRDQVIAQLERMLAEDA